jgi:hypothetical protein
MSAADRSTREYLSRDDPRLPRPAAPAAPAPGPAASDAALHRLLALRLASADVAQRTQTIYEQVLRDSPRVRSGNFDFIAPPDLALIFELYDSHFYDGVVRRHLHDRGSPLFFKLSHRLTRSAGATTRFQRKGPAALAGPPVHYEIAISTTLLFQSFLDVHRTVRVNGLVCRDRLQALQRVLEHELIHLLEMLAFGRSSCAAAAFQTLAWNHFAHTEARHDLVTQRERALSRFDVKVGDRVAFDFQGVCHVGIVNRITRRATVLVESPDGQPFQDGKRYRKFYIPLPMLKKAAETGP